MPKDSPSARKGLRTKLAHHISQDSSLAAEAIYERAERGEGCPQSALFAPEEACEGYWLAALHEHPVGLGLSLLTCH